MNIPKAIRSHNSLPQWSWHSATPSQRHLMASKVSSTTTAKMVIKRSASLFLSSSKLLLPRSIRPVPSRNIATIAPKGSNVLMERRSDRPLPGLVRFQSPIVMAINCRELISRWPSSFDIDFGAYLSRRPRREHCRALQLPEIVFVRCGVDSLCAACASTSP